MNTRSTAAFIVCRFPSVTSLVTVAIVGRGTVTPNYDGLALTNGVKYAMTARPQAGFLFAGWSGSVVTLKTTLFFTNAPGMVFTATFVDRQIPTLRVNPVPRANALTNAEVLVSGTAGDNDALAGVYWRLNGGASRSASTGNGWSNWWAGVTIPAGDNTLEVFARDISGNSSKTNRLKLAYPTAPNSLTDCALTAVKPDKSLVYFGFSSKTFSESAGMGGYTYKKANSISGRLSLTYTNPPSATSATNNATVLLQFTSPTGGVFTDMEGLNTFSLTPVSNLPPVSLTGFNVDCRYAGEDLENVLGFPISPVVAQKEANVKANPLPIYLSAPYPGQVGDQVTVTFSHGVYVVFPNYNPTGYWIGLPALDYTGTVTGLGTNEVMVWFIPQPLSTKNESFTLQKNTIVKINSCTSDTYARGVVQTNDPAWFQYDVASPVGAMLQLSQDGLERYLFLTFTNSPSAGTFYEEIYSATNQFTVKTGTFSVTPRP